VAQKPTGALAARSSLFDADVDLGAGVDLGADGGLGADVDLGVPDALSALGGGGDLGMGSRSGRDKACLARGGGEGQAALTPPVL